MLARNRFDPEALVRVVNAVQLRVGFQPLQPLGETDIEVRFHDVARWCFLCSLSLLFPFLRPIVDSAICSFLCASGLFRLVVSWCYGVVISLVCSWVPRVSDALFDISNHFPPVASLGGTHRYIIFPVG